MDKPMPNIGFKAMTFVMKIRDWLRPREEILKEIGIEPGLHVLDFGCGPGSYSLAAAEMVGKDGRIYALDIHSLAIDRVRNLSNAKGLRNVETIQSDCGTGLENSSVDVVLMADIFHMLSEQKAVLQELHRVLKPTGVLAFNDHHMKEDEILTGVTSGGLFKLTKKGEKIYLFSKEEGA